MPTVRSPETIPEALTISYDAGPNPVFGRASKSLTGLKCLGDDSFGTVWLCDWHSETSFPSDLSTPLTGPGSRPEYQDMRIVAVKRMYRKWRGDEEDWKRLREIQVQSFTNIQALAGSSLSDIKALCSIPRHPNIVALFDAFVDTGEQELYLVFEALEGHLFQLIKARRDRPIPNGLIASLLVQLARGIGHMHACRYMHRDLVPENILITTFGRHEYTDVYDTNDATSTDVLLVLKIADFGEARRTTGGPPYTEYVGKRWYRAPEVILKSHQYTPAVDMWALGCIIVELLNLRPLFPGTTEYDMMDKIVHVLGDPCTDRSADEQDTEPAVGGQWLEGVELGRQVGYLFPEHSPPQPVRNLVAPSYTGASLIDCISVLLKWDPGARLTSTECQFHPYIVRASAYVDALPSAPI